MVTDKLTSTIDKLAKSLGKESPGFSLLIGKGDQVVFHEGFGMADIEAGKPINGETRFLIASVTKQFVTMSIMILKERGLIDYDESISTYFPSFPSYINAVTVRHLMNHTAGIKEYYNEEFENDTMINDYDFQTINQEDIIRVLSSFDSLDFEPGSKMSYCNSGYVMLGKIVEKVSQCSLADFMDQNIFKPIGMTRTFYCTSTDDAITDFAYGYEKQRDNKYTKSPFDMMTVGWGDGAIISTVGDLYKWHKALNTEQIVSAETLKEAMSPTVLNDGTKVNYGFGWGIGQWKGHRMIGHSGGAPGYMTRIERFVDDDIVIIMLNNEFDESRDDFFMDVVNDVMNE